MKLFISQSHDPFLNLAFEESLLRADGESAFLWINDPCVVIGRNQDPYREVDFAFLKENGVELARRLSGGGSVYHDCGNLNYTIVGDALTREEPEHPNACEAAYGSRPTGLSSADCETACANRAATWALAALELMGVQAHLTGRNDITVDNRKVGGLAEYQDERCVQHGTLMVDVDLQMMDQALRPSPLKLAKHGISSVGSRVTNLSEFVSEITVEQAISAFEAVLGRSAVEAPASSEIHQRAAELRNASWVFGKYSHCDVNVERIIDGNLYHFALCAKNGIIESARISTDACSPVDIDALEQSLIGRPLNCN